MAETKDNKLFLWLIKQIRPYWLLTTAALIALTFSTGATLLTPVILQQTIDSYIRPVYVRTSDGFFLENRLEGRKSLNGNIRYVLTPPAHESVRPALDSAGIEYFNEKNTIAFDISRLTELPESIKKQINISRYDGVVRKAIQYLVLLFIILAATFLQVFFTTWLGQNVMRDIRLKLHNHLLRQSLHFFHEKPVGSLVSRIVSDVETINEFFTNVAADLIKDVSIMIGVLAVLYYLSPHLTFITIISLPPVLLATILFRKIIRETYRKMREQISKVNAFLSERISGMEIVQIFVQEDRTFREFEKENNGLMRAALNEMKVMSLFRPLIQMFTSCSIALVIYNGSGLIQKGALSIGVLIAFINLIEMFYQPIRSISEKFNIIQSALTGVERIYKLLHEKDEISREGNFEMATGEAGSITFDNVSFSYTEDPVLKNISFHIDAGQTVAIVGTTGSGKTTIASLIARFWDVDDGEILVDGRNIKNYKLENLRTRVQPVQQDIFLFGGSIRENILLSKNLSENELSEILEHSQASWFIDQLKDGLDSRIKERGSNFSTGQKQLISFARTMAQKPDILILDESTGNIDSETETYIQKGMARLLENRTALVIAHRLSTIKHADRIMVLDKGNIEEEGTHEELMAKEGFYYNLYKLQFSKDNF